MLNGVRDTTVVFGHSHLQFRAPGPNGTTLINPGSAGMPLDGDVRAAYALRHDDGEFEFRRVEYDVERAAQAWERHAGLGANGCAAAPQGLRLGLFFAVAGRLVVRRALELVRQVVDVEPRSGSECG